MRTRLIDFIINRASIIALAALILASYCTYRLVDFNSASLNIDVDASLTGLLPVRGDALDTYKRVRDRFGGDDILLVAWFDDELFSSDVLQRLKRFSRRAQRVPGVAGVDSLANALNVRSVDGDIRVDRLLRRLPKENTILDSLKADALANPLYRGQLVSNDGRGALIAIHFEPDLTSSDLTSAVQQIIQASHEEAGSVENFISGPVQARLELSRILFQDIRLALPLAIFVTGLIAALTLRNVRGVVLPLLSTGLGLVLMLVLFVDYGNALNFVTAIAPPVVFVIGFAFAVHVVSEFDHVFKSVSDKKTAVVSTIEEVFEPLTLTAVTTAIGFASLATSPISSIRVFGIYTSIGTLLCWGTALVAIPAILLITPVRVKAQASRSRLAAFAPSLARFDIRHRKSIFIGSAVLALVALGAASRVEVSTDYLSNFADDNPVRLNFDRIRTEFTGAVPVQVLFESDVPGAFTDPVHLKSLEDFDRWLEGTARSRHCNESG